MHPVEAIDNGRLSRDLLLLADGDEGQIETYRRTARFFACLREGAVKGQIGVRENSPEEAEVVSLAVEVGEQNVGMGTALLEHVIAWAGERGYGSILIKTGNSSIGPLYLYQSCGFRLEGIAKDHFTRHYPEPLFEGGLPCRDQLILRYALYSPGERERIRRAYWNLFLEKHPAYAGRPWNHWQFSYGEKLPNRLLVLVMTGKKRGTSSALELYEPGEEKPRAGALSLVTWGNGIPGCIIETEEILIRPFCEITGEEARLEGEGDLSLEYWRRVHGDHFRREYGEAGKTFHENIPVLFERFRVIFRGDGLNC